MTDESDPFGRYLLVLREKRDEASVKDVGGERMWRRNHHGSQASDAEHLHAGAPNHPHHNGTTKRSLRHVWSAQRIALLPVCAILLLMVIAGRWSSSIDVSLIGETKGERIHQDALPPEENPHSPVVSQTPGKLRFDWSNMTLHSDMAKRIHSHQTNCSLPLEKGGPLLPYGLGSSLHSWGNKVCYAMGSGSRAWTKATEPWIWLDEAKCNASDQSTMQCYFPSMELQCPNDVTTKEGKVVGLYSNCIDNVLGNSTKDQWAMLRAAATEYMFHNVSNVVIEEAERQLKLVFPGGIVPPDLITVHIRWGDKVISEMKKVPIQEYIDGVRSILAARNETSQVNIFLATEDPDAFSEFMNVAPDEWNIYIDQYFHDMKPYRPEKAFGQNNNMNADKTKGRAGLVALGSLLVAVEANDFVLTTASNWSRLINELRKNVLDPRCKGCTHMVDLRVGKDR